MYPRMRWRWLLQICGVGGLGLIGSACEVVEYVGLLPFSGQTQVPADAMIRVNYGDSVDLDGVALSGTVRLLGPDGEWPLDVVYVVGSVAHFRPLEPLDLDATYTLSASLGGFEGEEISPVTGGWAPVAAGRDAVFSTGGACAPVGWEPTSDAGSMRGKVLFTCPPTAAWAAEDLRWGSGGQEVEPWGVAPDLVSEPAHPYILDVWVPREANAQAAGREALWVRAGERWREVRVLEGNELSAARGDIVVRDQGCP